MHFTLLSELRHSIDFLIFFFTENIFYSVSYEKSRLTLKNSPLVSLTKDFIICHLP